MSETATSKREQLAEDIANYVETHARYADLTKREAVMEAVRVLTNDIGAAQQFVYAIGLEVDLYDYRFDGTAVVDSDSSFPHGRCSCGGVYDHNGICVDKCARESWDHD